MELRWKASFSATCFHAAACIDAALPVVDVRLAEVLEPAVKELSVELRACGLSSDSTLLLLSGLASGYENNRQLMEVAATRMLGAGALSEAPLSRLTACAAQLEGALLRDRPELVDELAVRGRPLREQWEARGPGLLRQAARLVGDEDFLVSDAEVVLVAPLVGGHGSAHLKSNRIAFEAVLTNPHEDLPETLRLAWLLAQLNLDLPRYSDPIRGPRLQYVASLATAPLVLAAAETVELAQLTPESLSRALSCWHLSASSAEPLFAWWDAFFSGNTRWPVALAALDAMLHESRD